jgi:excisionase family DNA binding protein
MEPRPGYMGVREVARRLGVSPNRVYRMVRGEAIPAVRVRGAIRIPVAAFDAWLAGDIKGALAAMRESGTRANGNGQVRTAPGAGGRRGRR